MVAGFGLGVWVTGFCMGLMMGLRVYDDCFRYP